MKKGMSTIISTVLLIGFAISLALTVFIWAKGYTERVSESAVSFVEGEIMCEQIGINAATDDLCFTLNIANTGYLRIDKIAVRALEPPGNVDIKDILLMPKENMNVDGFAAAKVEVIPIIKEGERLIGCNEKRIILECS